MSKKVREFLGIIAFTGFATGAIYTFIYLYPACGWEC